jgi:putative transposase
LKVPRVREGGYFPSLLEPRRGAERALAAVVQEAYVHGVSTRKVDELVKALGMGGISLRAESLTADCADIDLRVGQCLYDWLSKPFSEIARGAPYDVGQLHGNRL